MGLDIRVVSKLEKCDIQSDEAYEKYPNVIKVSTKYDLAFNQSAGLEDECYYKYSSSDYKAFRAGSYSGYGKWREQLSEAIGINIEDLWVLVSRDIKLNDLLGSNPINEIPFVELLCLSDCEGTIGPIVSKKLHNDFVVNRDKIQKYVSSGIPGRPTLYKDWMSLYDDFTDAFRIASNWSFA